MTLENKEEKLGKEKKTFFQKCRRNQALFPNVKVLKY